MLKFIHGYDARYWPGLEKNGLLNRHSGIKIHQHFATPENEGFNVIAADGGALHRLVRENGYPFYIDRLLGGTFYSRYDYDHALLQKYRDMLGEWFLGIQMHEWASCLNGDWSEIRRLLAGTPPPWTEQQIHDAVKAVSTCKWCIALACGTAREFSQSKYPETWQDHLAALRQFFKSKQEETGGLLLPCDSYGLAAAMEYKLAARAVMPEVGAQIGLMRLQVAVARGMSGALGRPWGAYYEPWGGEPFGACHFFEEPFNEWRLDNGNFPYDFSTHGPNGGSSRALQRRIYYYSLMSGAHFFSEEWGISNTFYNWRDCALTPYGEVKKDFIGFAERHPDIEPFIPFAIVLPREFEVIDLTYINDPNVETYLGRTLDVKARECFGHIKKVLRLVYARCGQSFGNEGHVMTNGRFGDFFDVIDEDAGEEAFAKYTCLVDASSDGGFARSPVGRKHRVLESADMDMLAHGLEKIIHAELPCDVAGGLHWLLNRSGDRWILALFNNEGVERSAEKGDCFLNEAKIAGTICFKKEPKHLRILHSWPEAVALERQADRAYGCTIPAGGFCLMEFHQT